MYAKRVVLIDPDRESREGITFLINRLNQLHVVNGYGDCEAAIRQLNKDNPDIVILENNLENISGIEAARQIRKLNRFIDVIMLTEDGNPQMVFKALRSGIVGFILKDDDFEDLNKGVTAIANGAGYLSSPVARMVCSYFHRNHNSPLSRRETQVLQYFAEGKTYVEIAAILCLSKQTIKSHLANIYLKLNVSRKSEAIEKARVNKFIKV